MEVVGNILQGVGILAGILFVFICGCIRGEQMEKERAERLVNSGKPFYTKKDGTHIYVQTAMHTTKED